MNTRRRASLYSVVLALVLALAAALLLLTPGCSFSSENGTDTATAGNTNTTDAASTATATIESGDTTTGNAAGAYVRRQLDFYSGISEPRCYALAEMARDSDRLIADNINSVSLLPPVLIPERAGGQPRVILEGAAASVEGSIARFHDAGLVVHLAPTVEAPGFSGTIDLSEATLENLTDDVLQWAETAESQQVELFSPLSRYNQVMGTEGASKWSAEVLPQVKERFHGKLVAKVAPDINGHPAPGKPYDFEALDYSGYDYIMLDMFPSGAVYHEEAYRTYVAEVLDRASAVAARDGLEGVMIGEFGGWRQQLGVDEIKGPVLGNDGQASAAAVVLDELERAGASGAFFRGWTTPGSGARNFPVEKTLQQYYGSSLAMTPAGVSD